jgi:hypothetical protein
MNASEFQSLTVAGICPGGSTVSLARIRQAGHSPPLCVVYPRGK